MGPSSGSVDAGFSSRRLRPRRCALYSSLAAEPAPRTGPAPGSRQTMRRRAPRRPDASPPESPCRTPLRPAASEGVGTGPVEVGGHRRGAGELGASGCMTDF
jgi:hypothetical protein